ncbi:MAG: V-type ATP synthase subunit F [Candidatus Njordarchaeales archaeon]
MKVAVIGDEILVHALELIGAEGFIIESDNQVPELLRKLASKNEYGIIILPERFVSMTRPLREELIRRSEITPIFIFVPDLTEIKGERAKELQRMISLAIGTEYEL